MNERRITIGVAIVGLALTLAVAAWRIGVDQTHAALAPKESPPSLVGDQPLAVQSWGSHPTVSDPAPPRPAPPPPPKAAPSTPASDTSTDSAANPQEDSPEPLEPPARKFARGYSDH